MRRGCVTPKQITHLKEAIEDSVDLLDGYEDLDEDLQEKIKKTLEDGHVSDDDWIGVRSLIDRVEASLIVLGYRNEPPRYEWLSHSCFKESCERSSESK